MSRHLNPADLPRLRAVSDPRLSPDGTRLAYVLSVPDPEQDRDLAHIHLIDVASGASRPLTRGPKGDFAPRWSPDGRRLAFLSIRGDEGAKAQVHLIDLDGGDARRVTSLEGGVHDYRWSPDGSRLVCLSTIRPPAETEAEKGRPLVHRALLMKADGAGLLGEGRTHLFVVDPDSEAALQVTEGDFWAGAPAWSPDGSEIAFSASMHEDRDLVLGSAIHAVPAAGGPARRITSNPTQASLPLWLEDGRILFAGSQGVSDPMTSLWSVPASGGEAVELLPGFDRNLMPGGPGYPGGAPQLTGGGRELLFCARVRGCTHAFRVPLAGGDPELLLGGDERVIAGLSAAAAAPVLAFVAADPDQTGDLHVLEGGVERRLTSINADLLGEVEVTRPSIRRFTAPDGTEIEAFVLAPAGGGPAPLLLDVHGGPHNAHTPALSGTHFFWQELVERGWCVVAPNPRGSDGYGRTFMKGVFGGWGERDQQDFMAVIDALVAEGVADPERLAVTGYSYGGFMTSWLTGHSDRFKAAVAGGAVTDMLVMYASSDAGPWIAGGELDAGLADFATLDRFSPVRYAGAVTAPMLILHGESDDRCPIGGAEALFAVLRARRHEVELVRYPGGSHLFIVNGRLSHRIDYQRRVVDWVTSHVRAAVAPELPPATVQS